ncbi:MAG: hypothetical protein ACSLFL_09190 [Alphaproteobacteria bacterium]
MNLNKVIEIIKLLKPEFYNKLTWTVAATGIALITSPFWESFFIGVFNRIGVAVPSSEYRAWLGFVLIVLALLYHLITTALLRFLAYKQSQGSNNGDAAKQEHDIKIFNQSKGQISEQEIVNFLSNLYGSHSYKIWDFAKISDYADFLNKPENEFIHEELKSSALKMSDAILKLVRWCSYQFFVHPRDQRGDDSWCHMQPRLNVDMGGSIETMNQYDDLAEELNTLIDDVESSYREYRHTIKNKCYV